MYEQYTYEALLREMIHDTEEEFDTSETSPLYASYAKTAAQAANAYRALDRVLELVFVATSEGDYLKMKTAEMDVVAEDAVPAVRSGIFNVPVPLNSRFFVEGLYFAVIKQDPVLLECETAGAIGNTVAAGTTLLPMDDIEGLETALLGDVQIAGREAESETELKNRYDERVSDPIASGNEAHYKEWAREVEGVGAVKVFPNWDGVDTVKVVIADENIQPASSALVDRAQAYIDPVQGQGEGQAPIGAFVTVESAAALLLNIEATIVLAEGFTPEMIQPDFLEALTTYLKPIAFQSENIPVVRYLQIGHLLLGTEGVLDYSNLLVNGQAANITLAETELPVIRQVNFSV